MTIKNGTDLGASFDRLKKSLKESDELREGNGIDGLTSAYAKLYVNVEHFINEFNDPETINDIDPGHHCKPGLHNYTNENEKPE